MKKSILSIILAVAFALRLAVAAEVVESGFTDSFFATVDSPSANNYGNISFGTHGELFVTGGLSSDVFQVQNGNSSPVTSAQALAVGVLVDGNILYFGDFPTGTNISFKFYTYDLTAQTFIKPPIDDVRAADIVKAPPGWGAFGGQLIVSSLTGVSAINPSTQDVTPIAADSCCSNLAFSNEGELLGTTYNNESLVRITPNGTISTLVDFAGRTEAVAVDRTSGDAFVVVSDLDTSEGEIYRVNLETLEATLFAFNFEVDPFSFPHPLAFSQDASTLYYGEREQGEYVIRQIRGFGTTVPVDIDIKPGNKRNIINPSAKGSVWVAVLSDTGSHSPFDPSSQINIPSVEFGPAGAKTIRSKVKDINKDGVGDLLLRFKIPDTGIACGGTEATLIGETFDGQNIEGTDFIKTVGCKPKMCHKKHHHEKHHGKYHNDDCDD